MDNQTHLDFVNKNIKKDKIKSPKLELLQANTSIIEELETLR